ncbi:MAG: TIGR02281 family clan AA aspartic protease [Gammaproteobacteria bacterium]|nr:TIGR02281 family clan AA aspartic protease [Gammaproteobacteria bacterium]
MRWLLSMGLVFACFQQAVAVERIAVEALFSNKAMVQIDGKRRLLKLDQPSPEGVVLISANSREAVIEVNGERQVYTLGSHVSSSFSQPELATAKIWRNRAGHYTTVGSINGRTVDFMVDTGASAVALHAVEAQRLGIPYRLEGQRMLVNTANGRAPAYRITLDRVQVGDISLQQVDGFVIDSEDAALSKTLLGMSFLNRVRMEDQGSVLLLHKKF